MRSIHQVGTHPGRELAAAAKAEPEMTAAAVAAAPGRIQRAGHRRHGLAGIWLGLRDGVLRPGLSILAASHGVPIRF